MTFFRQFLEVSNFFPIILGVMKCIWVGKNPARTPVTSINEHSLTKVAHSINKMFHSRDYLLEEHKNYQ